MRSCPGFKERDFATSNDWGTRIMTARVGLIIPSSNRMVEQEMVPAFPAGIAGHVARLRMTGANRLPFDQLLPRIGDAVRALTDARCDVVAFHCTANSMEGGQDRRGANPRDARTGWRASRDHHDYRHPTCLRYARRAADRAGHAL
jgi:hypothetical protein